MARKKKDGKACRKRQDKKRDRRRHRKSRKPRAARVSPGQEAKPPRPARSVEVAARPPPIKEPTSFAARSRLAVRRPAEAVRTTTRTPPPVRHRPTDEEISAWFDFGMQMLIGTSFIGLVLWILFQMMQSMHTGG